VEGFATVSHLTKGRSVIDAVINQLSPGIFNHNSVMLYVVQGGVGSRPGIRLKTARDPPYHL
jgi:hypothetical protein